MQHINRPTLGRTFGSGMSSTSSSAESGPINTISMSRSPTSTSGLSFSSSTPTTTMFPSGTAGLGVPPPPRLPRTGALSVPMVVKRATLTSKSNWWLVEMNEEEENPASFSSSEETAVDMYNYDSAQPSQRKLEYDPDVDMSTTPASPQIYNPPRHPSSIFSFPTPTSYSAPPNTTANLAPYAHGSASELFKCVVKKPDVVQLEINGEMQSNASDVTVQFLAELRVYTTLTRHRNICAFLGALENVGLVLEFIEGRTLYDVIKERPQLTRKKKIDYHNQLLDGLTHLHSYRLSHGDLSLLNIQVTVPSDTIKLLDFGRSVSADSEFRPPDAEPVDPFVDLHNKTAPSHTSRRVEQIHPGTRPFSAPEILRGECRDALLADAYSFGMILVCLDRCESVDVKPWDQRKDLLPKDLFDGCEVFEDRARRYLKKYNDDRKRLSRDDMIHDTE